jgi:hypothetical protein
MLIDNYREFLSTAISAGTKFVSSAEFCDTNSSDVSLIKHDVHSAFNVSIELASHEQSLGAASTFYFLEPTHKSLHRVDKKQIEETIYAVADMGHNIGLHLDVHDTLEKHGDLYAGLSEIKDWLENCSKKAVIDVNLHGNTELRKLYGSPKGLLKLRKNSSKAVPHKIEVAGKYVSMRASYDKQTIAENIGLRYWADARVYKEGTLVASNAYLSDNSGRLRCNLNKKRYFEVNDFNCISKTQLKTLTSARAILLVHPQFYT